MSKPTRGRSEAFTPQQNIMLRAALRRLRDRGDFSQVKLGAVLGISQQWAGRLLEKGSFSYASASALVRTLGFTSVDTFFASKKSKPEPANTTAAESA